MNVLEMARMANEIGVKRFLLRKTRGSCSDSREFVVFSHEFGSLLSLEANGKYIIDTRCGVTHFYFDKNRYGYDRIVIDVDENARYML